MILFSDDEASELRLHFSFYFFGSLVADPHGEDEEGLQRWASFDVEGT